MRINDHGRNHRGRRRWVLLAVTGAAVTLGMGLVVGAPRVSAGPLAQDTPMPTLDPIFYTPTATPDPFLMTPTPDPMLQQQPQPEQPQSPLPPPDQQVPPPSGVLTPTVAATEEPTPVPIPGFSLTADHVLNAAIVVPSTGTEGAVQLANGTFTNPDSGLTVVVSDTLLAFGDLNGDTLDDAALIVTTSQGGVRQGTDLVILTAQSDSITTAATQQLGATVEPTALRIDRGAVWADLLVPGPTDPACCPSLPLKRIYVLRGDQVLSLPAASYGRLFPYRYGDRYGYVNVLGEFVVPPKYVFGGDFVEGLALVSSDGVSYGFIDRLGNTAIPESFQFATPFNGGLSVAGITGSGGNGDRAIFIDRDGANVFGETSYSTAQPFSEGMAAVKTDDGRFGFVDRSGALAIPAGFDFALPFSEGLAPVVVGDKVGYADRRGVTVIDPQFDAGDSFSEGLAAVALTGTVGYIDHTGKFVIEPQFDRAERFSDGLAIAVRDGKERFINLKGADAFAENNYDDAQRFSEGLAAVRTDGKYGYIDTGGAQAIAPQFDVAGAFDNGLAVVEANDKWGVISPDGTWLVQLSLTPRTLVVTGTVPSQAALTAPGTQTVTFVPVVSDEIRAGACYTGSDIVSTPTAWRCGVAGGEPFDPCILAADGQTVVCGADPTTGEIGFSLELSQPLPAAGVEGKSYPGAWMFQLENGDTCRFNMSSSVTIDGEPVLYSCMNLTQLLGDIDKTTPTWTIKSVTTESDGQGGMTVTSSKPLAVTRIWLPGVTQQPKP